MVEIDESVQLFLFILGEAVDNLRKAAEWEHVTGSNMCSWKVSNLKSVQQTRLVDCSSDIAVLLLPGTCVRSIYEMLPQIIS